MPDDPWQSTLAQIKDVFNVDDTSPLLGNVLSGPPSVPNISKDFVFSEEPEDKIHFRYVHIEPLLQQTAALLDRALVDRSAYQKLGIEFFKAKLQIIEFLRLDAIHDKERQAGVYEVPHKDAEGRLKSEQALGSADPTIAGELGQFSSLYKDPIAGQQIELARVSAYNSLMPFYSSTSVPLLRSFPSIGTQGQGADTTGATVAQQQRTYSIWEGQHETNVRVYQQQAASLARTERITALSIKEAYLKKNIDFRQARTEVAKDLVKIRIHELCHPDSAMSYPRRMKPIKERIFADLRESFARMKAISEGLRKVYNIDQPLPDPKSGTFLDDAVTWTRLALNKLLRLARLDQNYVYRVSLAERLSPTNFNEGIDTVWKVRLERSDFPFQCLTRIRGLAAFSRDDSGDVYQIAARVPKGGQIWHWGEVVPVELDQSDIPRCWLSRVGPRNAARDADVSGAQALHNCSPIGEWELELDDSVRPAAKKNKLQDIELNIYLAVQQSIDG